MIKVYGTVYKGRSVVFSATVSKSQPDVGYDEPIVDDLVLLEFMGVSFDDLEEFFDVIELDKLLDHCERYAKEG